MNTGYRFGNPGLFAGLLLAVGAFSLTPLPAEAQASEPLVADRPDFVEAADVIGRARVQLETSVAAAWPGLDAPEGVGFSLPTLLRVGVGADLELRLETGLIAVWTGSPGPELADISLGLKWRPWLSADGSLAAAWLLAAELPTGTGAARGHGIRPQLLLSLEQDLAPWSWGLMPGAGWQTDGEGRRYWVGILGAVVARELAAGHSVFAEFSVVEWAPERFGGADLRASGGWTMAIHDDLQVDAALSIGLTDAAPLLGGTIGVVRRF